MDDELRWEEENSFIDNDNWDDDFEIESSNNNSNNTNKRQEEPKLAEDVIKVKAYLSNITFPKAPKVLGVDDDTWGVTKWDILEIIEGNPETNRFGEITVTGEFFGQLEYNKPYIILAKANETKYGMQYKLMYYNQELDLTKVQNQRAFLSTILTDLQIKEVFDTLDDPLQSISNHDVEALMKVKGIGPYIAKKIVERYEENKDMSAVYAELDGYGVTPSIIGKLSKFYKSPVKIVDMVKNHPYQLTFDIDGIGFKTADAIALKGGLHPKDPDRIGAWIHWFLEEEGNKGHSYITASELINNLYYFFDGRESIEQVYYDDDGNVIGNNILESMNNLKDKGIICLEEREDGNKSRRRVYLKKYWDLEMNIAKELKRLLKAPNRLNYIGWEEKIKALEKQQGFEFAEEQREGIKLGLQNNVCFIAGGAGCVDADTEFFTGTGWKRIADYQKGDKVLQWNKDGNAELVEPISFIKEPCDKLWHFENKTLSQTISDEHRIIYKDQYGKLRETTIENIIEKQKTLNRGFTGKFITTFNYSGPGIDLTDEEIRIMIAVIADGWFDKNTTYCRIGVKKERKKERMRQLLQEANIQYEERFPQDKTKIGYSYFFFYAPKREKIFEDYWYNCNYHQLQIVAEEVIYWDGHITKSISQFFSTIKKSADFVQFAFSATGYRSSIWIDDREEKKNLCYTVSKSNKIEVGWTKDSRPGHNSIEIKQVSTIDGYKYCFKVPSSYLILRNNGRIFVTGNCGKSSLVSGILAALDRYEFAQCALSGRASARLTEVTGQEGYTIHRLLKYQGDGFEYNENNKLPYQVIILDEVSLCGGEIFLSLLKAIETGAHIYFIGDMGQLEAIGALNLAADMFNSSVIPTVELTKIHRQAAKSGIITTSQLIRSQEQLFDSNFEDVEIRGELQDMELDVRQEKDEILQRALNYYEKFYHSDLVQEDVMKIQLISPVKERGQASVLGLNLGVQALINPVDENDSKLKLKIKINKEEYYYIQAGDKVMNMKNNYNTLCVDGTITAVFNGWSGVVKDIDDNYVYVDFPLGHSIAMIEKKDAYNQLTLGHAATTHKMQGDSAPVIIGVIDYATPPSLLTKQQVYTLITRAKYYCILVCQNGALRKAIATDYVSTKRTFLPELLEGDV